MQKEDEPFEQFVMDLRILIKDCGYATDELKNEMVRDHIVFGIRNGKIREELIKEGSELTLDKCIDIARTYELSQTQSKKMENEDKSVNYCQAKPKKKENPLVNSNTNRKINTRKNNPRTRRNLKINAQDVEMSPIHLQNVLPRESSVQNVICTTIMLQNVDPDQFT